MSIQDILGWATSVIASLGLADFPKALLVMLIAVGLILRFAGRRD